MTLTVLVKNHVLSSVLILFYSRDKSLLGDHISMSEIVYLVEAYLNVSTPNCQVVLLLLIRLFRFYDLLCKLRRL